MRTRLTSFSPSMMGMLMSVTMMSYLADASLRRPSTPSSASVTRRLRTRASANTKSCRIIGESSTIKQEYSAIDSHAEVQERLETRQLMLCLGEQARGDERLRRVLAQ